MSILAIVAFSHDPDLITLVQAQIDAVHEDAAGPTPDPRDVIADAMALARSDIRDRAAGLVICNKVDECTATAIVLNRFADWIEGEL